MAESLKKPTTLVILDGLDESTEFSKPIIEEAKRGSHRLLLTSRPYGVHFERDCKEDGHEGNYLQVLHKGMNQDQVLAYVHNQLSPQSCGSLGCGQSFVRQGEELLTLVEQSQHLQELVKIPVNLKILVALWKGGSI